jgi:large subunit ribosomal protein L15
MKLNEIQDNSGARQERTRVGRGIGSGRGKTSSRGQKGLGARSGGKVKIGFEGGQNPLYRRLPMRGFNNKNFTKNYTIINVGDLQKLVDTKRLTGKEIVTIEMLQEIGFTKKAHDGLKVLGNGEMTASLTIDAAHASKSAIEKVKKAGGELNIVVNAPAPIKNARKDALAKEAKKAK